MRKLPIVTTLLLLPAIGLFSLIGDSPAFQDDKASPRSKKTNPLKKTTTEPAIKQPVERTPLEGPTKATIKGTVKYKGDPPAPRELTGIKQHPDAQKCLKGPEMDLREQFWMVSKDKGVANVVVSLAPPDDKMFKITDELKAPFKTPVVMDQPFCMFRPHVVALYARVQPLVVKNSAEIAHNVKIQAGPKDGTYDSGAVPPKGEFKAGPFSMFPAGIVNISCTMHGWMVAKAVLFPHPYFAVILLCDFIP